MPKLKLTLPPPETPWMKTPFILIDQLLPKLKDTELRILLLLLRRSQSRFRKADRALIIPYRQLMEATGRQSEAISKAIGSLSRRGLIHRHRPVTQRATHKPNKPASQSEAQQY